MSRCEVLDWSSCKFVKSLANVNNRCIFSQERQRAKCHQPLHGGHQFLPPVFRIPYSQKALGSFPQPCGNLPPSLSAQGRMPLEVSHQSEASPHPIAERGQSLVIKEGGAARKAEILNFILLMYSNYKL